MYQRSAKFYDLIYSGKDYFKEAESVSSAVKSRHPKARTLLDVACGTGEHAKYFGDNFLVTGIDLNSELLEEARRKCGARFAAADMRRFNLGETFDVVTCLFGSIGYLLSSEDCIEALTCFRRHLRPNGLVIVEPWISPAQWKQKSPFMIAKEVAGMKVCRMDCSSLEDNIATIEMHYLIGEKDSVGHYQERHQLALYSTDELLGFFEAAGLKADFDPVGISGRGLFIAAAAED